MRAALIAGYRGYARCIVWLPGPRLFVNSIPKAGTHLVTTILQELPGTMLAGVHISNDARKKITKAEDEVDFLGRQIRRARPGQILTGHLPWKQEIEDSFAADGCKMIHVVRDPRDILVSQLFYIEGLRRHRLHHRLMSEYSSREERLAALIRGDLGMPGEDSIGRRLERYAGWMRSPRVLLVRFEDLVGQRGGGNEATRRARIGELARFVERDLSEDQLDGLLKRLDQKQSFTFRKGKIGDWSNHLTPEHRHLLEQDAGATMAEMGYQMHEASRAA